ncbi:MAG: cytochrome c [Acidimicrobiales bacterium]
MTRLRKATSAAQWLVGTAAATAVVLLFTLDGSPDTSELPLARQVGDMVDEGREIYAQQCATCHGAEGQGGQGPPLAGTVLVNYPDAADQIDIVTNGGDGMPPYADVLTELEIASVVAFTRFALE